VTPVAIVTLHSWYAGSAVVCADKVNVAVDVPVFALVLVNVVVPHPLVAGVDNDPPNLNCGRTSVILSEPASSCTFNTNANTIAEGAPCTAFAMTNELCSNAGMVSL
jgi:hypothetical protein